MVVNALPLALVLFVINHRWIVPISAGLGYNSLSLEECGLGLGLGLKNYVAEKRLDITDSVNGAPLIDLLPFQEWDVQVQKDGKGIKLELRGGDLWSQPWCASTVGTPMENAQLWTSGCSGAKTFISNKPNNNLTCLFSSTPVRLKEQESSLCITPTTLNPGANLKLAPCSSQGDEESDQLFYYEDDRIVHKKTSLCLDAGSHHSACTKNNGKRGVGVNLPFCDVSLSFEERVDDVVKRLSLSDKSFMLSSTSGGAGDQGIHPIQWWNEALHGLANNVGVVYRSPLPGSTSFPMPILLSSTFDKTLFHRIGVAISDEARAFANIGHSGLTFWAPNVNIFRDPRWGRGQETPGEDPYLSGQYAKYFVKGMQEGDPSGKFLKTSACCKHYSAYSLEAWGGVDRNHFNAIVSDLDLAETYLPAFQSCITAGKASSIMCSYNSVNGVPSCANEFLMNKLARGEWSFKGYITSDCGAVSDIPNSHFFTNSTEGTVASVLRAGMDIGCDEYLVTDGGGRVNATLNSKVISLKDLDTAISNLLLVRMRLGEFDPSTPFSSVSVNSVCSKDHLDLAREAARKGIVLLSNPRSELPLHRELVKSVAVVGPLADNAVIMGGPNYNGIPCSGKPITVLGAFKKQSTLSAEFALGCDVSCLNGNGFAEAASLSSKADITVVVVGIDGSIENEGMDRVNITLPNLQNNLVEHSCKAAKNGICIVVILSGGSQDVSPFLPYASAIIYAGLLGEVGSEALVDLIFGDTDFSGRLTQTFYPKKLHQRDI